MTTPVDIAMPYGVTVVGDGTRYARIFGDHKRKYDSSSLNIPPGPCRVVASWSGNEEVRITLVTDGPSLIVPIPQNGGGGTRSVMVTYGARHGDRVYLETGRGQVLPAGTTGTLEIYPLNFEQ